MRHTQPQRWNVFLYDALAAIIVAECLLTGLVAALSFRISRRVPNRPVSFFAAAFMFLFLSGLVKLSGTAGVSDRLVLPVSAAVETVGFFLLALSHVYSVREAAMPLLALLPYPESTVYSLAKGVSLYLILYAAVETTISYLQTNFRGSLLSSVGLYVLFVAQAVSAFTVFGIAYPIVGESLSLVGYLLLALPGLLAYYSR